jgi:undecaprenyl-phosphate galactose phosphotransferase
MIKLRGFINRLRDLGEVSALLVLDIVSLLVILKLSVLIRKDLLPHIYPGFPPELPFGSLEKSWWIFLVWIFFFYYEGLYTKRFPFWDEIKALWKTSFFSTVGIFTIVSIGKLSGEVSRTVIVLMGITGIVLLPLIRVFFKKILRRLGFFKKRVLILGAGETGRLIAKALKGEPNYGYEVIGFLDDDPEKVGRYIDGIKIHRGVDRAANYIKRCNVRDIFIAMPGAKKERLQALINELQYKVERVLLVPDMFGMAVLGTTLHHFFHEQAFALEIRNNLERPSNIFIKGCFDFIMAGLSMLFLSIPMLIISILIRLDSKGPAIFSQERVGRRSRTFRCYKFRTMYNDADERLERLLANDDDAREEWNKFWKLKDDPRVTRIGKFLRKTSLDELPQLFNVLKGEMSLVGPRPVTQDEIDGYYKDMADLCFTVPPGITGLWQVSGRSSTSYDYRIALDSWYVRNWNLWLDIVILLKTVKVVLKKEGAY